METVEVVFTLPELIYIDDHITPDLSVSGSSNRATLAADAIPYTRDFINQLGMALLDAYEKLERNNLHNKTVENSETVESSIKCTVEDLWTLRDLGVSTVMVGEERVGINIKLKVYRAFRELQAQSILSDF